MQTNLTERITRPQYMPWETRNTWFTLSGGINAGIAFFRYDNRGIAYRLP